MYLSQHPHLRTHRRKSCRRVRLRKRNTHPRNDLFRCRTRHWQYNISI